MLFDDIARLAVAVLIAFVGMIVVKSRRRRTLVAWILRLAIALPLFAAALLLVFVTIPYPRDSGAPTLTIVASAVLIGGLAAEELIGAEIRRMLGI